MALFEFTEGTSRKFYRIEKRGACIDLHWGRFGTKGQRKTLTLGSADEATDEYRRLLSERTERGYWQVVDESVPRAEEAEVAAPERSAAAAPLSESPRFHFKHPKRREFAWVECRGAKVLTAQGPLGREAQTPPEEKTCASVAVARAQRDAFIAQLMGRGFSLADVAAKQVAQSAKKRGLHTNEALERAVAAAPHDEARWQVLEDWLLEADDLRGELIRAEKTGSRADEAESRGRVAKALWGPHERSIATAVGRPRWRAGYLRECVFSMEEAREVAAFSSFMSSVATRLLETLVVRLSAMVPFVEPWASVASARCVDSLRDLQLATLPVPVELRVLEPFTVLEKLSLGPAQVGSAWSAVGRLRQLEVSPKVEDEALELARSSWPRLEVLEFNVGSPAAVTAFAQAVQATGWPALQTLALFGLDGPTFEVVLGGLERNGLLSRLQQLTVSMRGDVARSPAQKRALADWPALKKVKKFTLLD